MIANWLKIVSILIGGTVAAAGAAYVTGVFEPSPGSPRVEAAAQQPRTGQAGEGKEAPEDGDAMAGEGEKADGGEQQVASLPPSDEPADAGAPAKPSGPTGDVIVPAFDLVRVEPDGSLVIAGIAAPGSTVEVIAGATVIGTEEAGVTGDFAVVLDEPLDPGDYTIVLRSTTQDNVVTTSAQTAIISVPETEDGQVLALVEEPGEPSRLITVPSAPEPKEEMAAKGDRPATPKAGEEAVAEADGAAGEQQPKPAMQADAGDAASEPKPEMNADAGDATEESGAKPEMKADVPEADGQETELAGAQEAPAGETAPAKEQQVAAADQSPAEAPEAEKPARPRVAVEAVEIEGRKVFVAGYAEAGSTVRVYANDILLGQATASDAGRFLIEAEKDLPVGDYIVRADMLSPDKADVVARAAVPFEREPGEKLSAVAPQEPIQVMAEPETAAAEEDAATEEMASDEAGAPAEELAGETASDGTATGPETETTEMAALDQGEGADAQPIEPQSRTEPESAVQPTAPKLENVSGAVIIRRGDTLWHLSRRVYGRGIRYTTIYLANQDQIADPDMIWPGQVFSVPGETEEGEEADMSAVAEQMADPDETSEDVVTR
jgi:nucleoid-associated protein YgaU